MKRIAALVLLVTLFVGIHTVSAAPLDPEPFITGAVSQRAPTASEDWFAWTETPRGNFEVRVRAIDSSGAGHKLVGPGRNGFAFTGGLDASGDLIYQRGSFSGKGSSDLRVYDPDSGNSHAPPPGVNTSKWEWSPSWSQDFLLFGRNTFKKPSSPWSVVLYDRTTNKQKVLAKVRYACRCIAPGNVTDAYATWTLCTSRCNVFVYDIAAKDTVKVPNPQSKQIYDGSVTSGGDVYYARSGNGCGANVSIMRWKIGDPAGDAVVVSDLPNHIEITDPLWAFTKADMHTDVYFGRFDCRHGKADIYVVHDAETASRTVGTGSVTPGVSGAKRLQMTGASPKR